VDSHLNVSINNQELDGNIGTIIANGYSLGSLYNVNPVDSHIDLEKEDYKLDEAFDSISVVLSKQEAGKYNVDFNSGIYLVNSDSIFIGIAEEFISNNIKDGFSININKDIKRKKKKEYIIKLDNIPENYKVKDVLYIVNFVSVYEKQNEITGSFTRRTTKKVYMYKLPVVNCFNIGMEMVLTPDYRNISRILLYEARTEDGLSSLFFETIFDMAVSVKRALNIQEIYSKLIV
jgi:hypothetical protein